MYGDPHGTNPWDASIPASGGTIGDLLKGLFGGGAAPQMVQHPMPPPRPAGASPAASSPSVAPRGQAAPQPSAAQADPVAASIQAMVGVPAPAQPDPIGSVIQGMAGLPGAPGALPHELQPMNQALFRPLLLKPKGQSQA
jgi:hypothetical protein